MKQTPLVSVIIPFLNPGIFLSDAIESVLHQTFHNWEIILVDDGSVKEDSATAIAYSKKFSNKIHYLQHEGHANKGLTVSRNAGVKKAKGEFIALLDADDCWLRQKLERQLDLFERFPEAQMICEASRFWYSWNDAGKEDSIFHIGTPPGLYHPPELMKRLYPLGLGQPPCPSGIIITREAMQRSGAFEEGFSGVYQLYEDQAFLSKVYSKEIIYISDQVNNLYRKREGSMSSAAGDENIYKTVRLFYHAWLEDYFSKHPAENAIKQLLKEFKKKLMPL